MTAARPDMRVHRQNAFPDADLDVLAATDWLFPHGMDHHRMMTGTQLGNDVFVKLVRQMGGAGELPDDAPVSLPPSRDEHVDVCIVGAGPAGLSAAREVATAGARVLLIDEQDRAGGSLLAEPNGIDHADSLLAAAIAAGARVLTATTALGYYPEDRLSSQKTEPAGLLVAATPEGLLRISARRFIYATGAYDQSLPFPDNDRPGVLSARAVGRLVFRFGIKPAPQVTVVVDPGAPWDYADRLTEGLAAYGTKVTQIDVADLPGRSGKNQILAVAARPAPASELPRHHGAQVLFDEGGGGFGAKIDDRFQTTVPGVFAVGDVTGYLGPQAAERAGTRAGLAALNKR